MRNPTINIVTPSFNQAQFLEATIQSVVGQSYPNLEYMVLDGGSTDGSVEVIRRHEAQIDYWVSERDRGQTHAINKGFARAAGDILGWVNSDDLLERGSLQTVAQYFSDNPDWQCLTGRVYLIDGDGDYLDADSRAKITPADRKRAVYPEDDIDIPTRLWSFHRCWFPQQATFWRRSLLEQVGPLNEHLHYVMDYELWQRFSQVTEIHTVPDILARYRFHESAKCCADSWGPMRELIRVNSDLMPPEEYKQYYQEISDWLIDTLVAEQKKHQHFRDLSKKLERSHSYRLGHALLVPLRTLAHSIVRPK